MTDLSPFLSIDLSCEQALQIAQANLARAGLGTMQTFNLSTARLGLHDCSCPNHGTDECDCQMIVLLVYGVSVEPATLILHGNNGQTWLSLVNNSLQHIDPSLQRSIEQALQGNSPR